MKLLITFVMFIFLHVEMAEAAVCFAVDAFLGAEMVCTATGFLQLQRLGLQNLHGLKKWRMDEGAMPKSLLIRN